MKSKQQIGREYRIKTLKFLACVGYATTRQISMAVLGACDVSSRKMAGPAPAPRAVDRRPACRASILDNLFTQAHTGDLTEHRRVRCTGIADGACRHPAQPGVICKGRQRAHGTAAFAYYGGNRGIREAGLHAQWGTLIEPVRLLDAPALRAEHDRDQRTFATKPARAPVS